MESQLEFNVKIKSFTWKSYKLIIGETDFQLIKQKSNTKKPLIYSLTSAVVLDKSEKNDFKILISSPFYRFQIKILNQEDKQLILSKLEEIIKKKLGQNCFQSRLFKTFTRNI